MGHSRAAQRQVRRKQELESEGSGRTLDRLAALRGGDRGDLGGPAVLQQDQECFHKFVDRTIFRSELSL